MKYIDFIMKPVLRILFPPHCLHCGKALSVGVICEDCLAGIPRHTTLFCARCGARLPDAKKICHRDAAYLLGSAGPYDHPALKCLIHNLKFRSIRGAAEPLAGLIAEYLAAAAIDPNNFLLIPVPLSRERRNERGFNQAEEIARHLGELLSLHARTDILARTLNTKPQTETKNIAERRRNVLACFSVIKPDDVAKRDILLIDDVTTSGATLGAAAHALRDAGARKIICITAAKA